MKNIIGKQELIFAGIGLLTAIVVFKFIIRDKKTEITSTKPVLQAVNNGVVSPTTKSADGISSFCGCGA
jgi:branched-subunit amino acid transport protein